MLARHRHVAGALLFAAGLGVWLGSAGQSEHEAESESPAGGPVVLLGVQDAIGPATSDYIRKGLAHAREQGASLVVLEMDTPGGLDTAMREIIQAILASDIPVATYVWPEGARAASAGTYILYASHVAAMAPATNLGAATPIAIGGTPAPTPSGTPDDDSGSDRGDGGDAAEDGDADGEDTAADGEDASADGEDAAEREEPRRRGAPELATASERKAVNDAVAYIRSLAERRGRNAEWAERAVRSAESLSADAALAMDVIDIVAADLDDLLRQLDGRAIDIDGESVVLATGGATRERFEPDWRTRFLAVISNPTIAYLLMLVGIYGLIFEGYNPGAIVPGVVGAISLLLALFAFQILPVNYAGLALILLGVILMIAEFLVPSFGALGFGGIAAFVFGSLILIDTDVPGFAVARPLIISIATAGGLVLLGIVWFAMRSRVRPVVSGVEEMTHTRAAALEDFDREGAVWAHGERWRARTRVPVRKGQALRITRVDGLTLEVEPATDE